MATNLSVQNWKEANFYLKDFPDVARWDEVWEVTIPPLPSSLDNADPYAVKLYILALCKAIAQAGLEFARFEITGGDKAIAKCELSTTIPETYQVKGLQEWQIRDIAFYSDDLIPFSHPTGLPLPN